MGDEQVRKGPEVVTTTVEASEGTVREARQEIPVGQGGQPIDRLPLRPQFKALVDAGTYVKRIAGQERCLRVVALPLKGGSEGLFHCSRVCVSAGTDGEKYCPEHDKEIFRPAQDHPPRPGRTFNSASIELTEAEKTVTWEKDGVRHKAILEQGRDVGAERSEAIAPSARPKRARAPKEAQAPKRRAPKGDELTIRLCVSDLALEDREQVVHRLVRAVVEGLDGLPAGSVADVKRIMAIQEKLEGGI